MVLVIGALGLTLVGFGIVFIHAGWKGQRVGQFFDQLRGGAPPAPTAAVRAASGAERAAELGQSNAAGVAPILPPSPAPTPSTP